MLPGRSRSGPQHSGGVVGGRRGSWRRPRRADTLRALPFGPRHRRYPDDVLRRVLCLRRVSCGAGRPRARALATRSLGHPGDTLRQLPCRTKYHDLSRGRRRVPRLPGEVKSRVSNPSSLLLRRRRRRVHRLTPSALRHEAGAARRRQLGAGRLGGIAGGERTHLQLGHRAVGGEHRFGRCGGDLDVGPGGVGQLAR